MVAADVFEENNDERNNLTKVRSESSVVAGRMKNQIKRDVLLLEQRLARGCERSKVHGR